MAAQRKNPVTPRPSPSAAGRDRAPLASQIRLVAEEILDLFLEDVGRAVQDLEIPGITARAAAALDDLEDSLPDDSGTAGSSGR